MLEKYKKLEGPGDKRKEMFDFNRYVYVKHKNNFYMLIAIYKLTTS